MKAIDILMNKYGLVNNEIFWLKNVKSNKFLSSYIFDSTRQQYKYILESFKICNGKLYALSDVNNIDVVLTLRYIDGIYEQIINGVLVIEKDISNICIDEKYEDKLLYNDEDTWRK